MMIIGQWSWWRRQLWFHLEVPVSCICRDTGTWRPVHCAGTWRFEVPGQIPLQWGFRLHQGRSSCSNNLQPMIIIICKHDDGHQNDAKTLLAYWSHVMLSHWHYWQFDILAYLQYVIATNWQPYVAIILLDSISAKTHFSRLCAISVANIFVSSFSFIFLWFKYMCINYIVLYTINIHQSIIINDQKTINH